MQSPEAIARYRAMQPGERLAHTLEAIREHSPALLVGSPDIVRRRFELLRRRKDESNRRLLERLTGACAP